MIPPVSLQQQHPHQHRRRHSYQAVPLDLFSPPTIRIEAPSPAARPKIAFGKRRPLSTAALHGWLKDVEPLSPSARSPPTPVGSPKKPSGAPSTAASHYDADADDSEWAYPLSATPHDARLRSVEDLAERARRLDAVRDELLRQHTRLALDGRGPHERNRRAGGGDGLRKETLSKGLWSGIKNRFASSKSLANLATLADPSRRGSKLINKQVRPPSRRPLRLRCTLTDSRPLALPGHFRTGPARVQARRKEGSSCPRVLCASLARLLTHSPPTPDRTSRGPSRSTGAQRPTRPCSRRPCTRATPRPSAQRPSRRCSSAGSSPRRPSRTFPRRPSRPR